MKPIIGLNCGVSLRDTGLRMEITQTYTQAVEMAGGIPMLLAATEDNDLAREQVGLLNGLVLIGGSDYDPALYGEAPHPKTKPSHDARTAYDVKVVNAAWERRLPTLGICAGLQIVNIVRGGTLHQHVPEMPGVTKEHGGHLRDDAHDVIIEKGSRLAAVVGEAPLPVNSTHHQAVARIGRGLCVTARSTDGVIETLESTNPDDFLICVQWHPERLVDRPRHLALFKALVQAASQ